MPITVDRLKQIVPPTQDTNTGITVDRLKQIVSTSNQTPTQSTGVTVQKLKQIVDQTPTPAPTPTPTPVSGNMFGDLLGKVGKGVQDFFGNVVKIAQSIPKQNTPYIVTEERKKLDAQTLEQAKRLYEADTGLKAEDDPLYRKLQSDINNQKVNILNKKLDDIKFKDYTIKPVLEELNRISATGAATSGIINKSLFNKTMLTPYEEQQLKDLNFLDDKGNIKVGKTAVETAKTVALLATFTPEAFIPIKMLSEAVTGGRVVKVGSYLLPLAKVVEGGITGGFYNTLYTPNLEKILTDKNIMGDAVKRYFIGATVGSIISIPFSFIKESSTALSTTVNVNGNMVNPVEFKDTYMRLARKYHPDNLVTGNTKVFQEITKAYKSGNIEMLNKIENASADELSAMFNTKIENLNPITRGDVVTNRPSHQVELEKLINAGKDKEAQALINSIPDTDPYKQSMQKTLDYVTKGATQQAEKAVETVGKRQFLKVDLPKEVTGKSVLIRPDGTASFNIEISKTARGKGIGTDAVTKIETAIYNAGVRLIKIPVKSESVGFFEKQGYKVTGEADKGIVPMEKNLTEKPSNNIKQTNNSLIEEAKKYKSAEEFVNSQGITLYHGSDKKIKVFSNKKGAQGVIWFTDNPKAITAGESGAQETKYINERITTGKKFAGWDEYDKYTLGEIQSMGFDGIKLPTEMNDGTKYNDYVLFDNRTLKNANKLTDIWNKANEKLKTTPKTINIKPKTVSVPRDQLPIQGTGKLTLNKLEARVKGFVKGMTKEQIDSLGISAHRQLTNDESISKATKYAIEHPQDAIAVLKGDIPAPKGILNNALYVALNRMATNDFNLATKLSGALSTRLGQEIQILSNIDKNSPVSIASEIYKLRADVIQKRYKGKNITQIRKDMVKKGFSKIKAPTIIDWEAIIKEVRC